MANLKHSVYDTDTHFSINPVTRALVNQSSGKNCVIQYDHNSERVTFEIPRMVEGHDMSQCDSIQVHYCNIDSKTKEQSNGLYEVDDMQISPDSDDVVVLSWLISRNATQYVGSLNFLVAFKCVDTESNLIYRWNTAVYSGISVSTGINNGEEVVEEYADVLEQWRASIDALELADVEHNRRLGLLEENSVTKKYVDDNFVPNLDTNDRVYVKDSAGNNGGRPYTQSPTPSSLVWRNSNGLFQINDAVQNNQPVSKGQMESALDKVKIYTSTQMYGRSGSGVAFIHRDKITDGEDVEIGDIILFGNSGNICVGRMIEDPDKITTPDPNEVYLEIIAENKERQGIYTANVAVEDGATVLTDDVRNKTGNNIEIGSFILGTNGYVGKVKSLTVKRDPETGFYSVNGYVVEGVGWLSDCSPDDLATKEYVDNLEGKIYTIAHTDPHLVGDHIHYYDSLNACIADVNGGVYDSAVAKHDGTECCTFKNEEGIDTVVLLKDIETETAFTPFSVPVVLDLAGRVVTCDFSAATANIFTFTFTAACESAKIIATNGGKIRVNGGSKATCAVYSSAKKFEVFGGTYELTGQTGGQAVGICLNGDYYNFIHNVSIFEHNSGSVNNYGMYTMGNAVLDSCNIHIDGGVACVGVQAYWKTRKCNVSFNNCRIRCENGTNQVRCVSSNSADATCFVGLSDCVLLAKGIGQVKTYGLAFANSVVLNVANCYICADSPNNSNDTYWGAGIVSYGSITVNDSYVCGTTCGVSANSMSIINNCQLLSCGHGGVYFGKGTHYIKNSTLGCAEYSGDFDVSAMDVNYEGDFFIGDANDIAVYMDNCTLTGVGQYCGVLRGTDGEHGNSLYISRTAVPTGKNFRVDGDNSLIAGAGMTVDFDTIFDGNPVEGGNHLSTTNAIYTKGSAEVLGYVDNLIGESGGATQSKRYFHSLVVVGDVYFRALVETKTDTDYSGETLGRIIEDGGVFLMVSGEDSTKPILNVYNNFEDERLEFEYNGTIYEISVDNEDNDLFTIETDRFREA